MNTTPNSGRNKGKLSEVDFAKALVRIEGEVRKTNVREYMASSVMSDRQWSIFIELKRELATRGLTILAGVPLTAIIDPRLCSMPDALWRSSVLFAIVTMPPRGAVRILVLDDDNAEMERCLDRLEVQHIAYNSLLNDSEFAKVILDEIDFQFQSFASAKSLINRSENDVAESLRNGVWIIEYERLFVDEPAKQEMRRHFESESMKLLHEVALHRICTSDLIGGLLTYDEDQIRTTSSVDILVHAPPPLSQPLLAVEFDGPHHDDPEKQRKDRLKDAVLAHYGIPLIRIAYADAAFGNLSRDGKTDLHRRYVEGLTELVGTVVWQTQFEADFAIRADKANKALHTLEDHLAVSQFGKPYVELNVDQRQRVDGSTFCSKEEEECRFENSLYNYERDKAMESAKEEAAWPKELLQYSSCPEIHGDKLTGFSTTFKVDIPNQKCLEVTLPKIWVQAKSLDDELLKARVTSDLLQIAADLIRQVIRMNTPAGRR
jgi:hypothetical protein